MRYTARWNDLESYYRRFSADEGRYGDCARNCVLEVGQLGQAYESLIPR